MGTSVFPLPKKDRNMLRLDKRARENGGLEVLVKTSGGWEHDGNSRSKGERLEWRKEGMGRGTLASVTPDSGGQVHGCLLGGREQELRW